MGSILKDIALTTVVIFLNHWIYGIEDAYSYNYIVELIARKQLLFLSIGIVGSIALLASAVLFETLGLYKITYGLSLILVRVSQFLITFLALLNVAFYVSLGNNLLHDNGYLAVFLLSVILGASCWSIRVIDFNYPVKNTILPVGILTLVSLMLVELVLPLM